MCQRAAVSIPARVSVAGGRRFPKWDCINGRQRKSPRRAGPWLARPVLPSRFTGPLGHKAALAACSHELDLQRETHRWRKPDSNSWSLSRIWVVEFAPDSLLEEGGFEPPVPLANEMVTSS